MFIYKYIQITTFYNFIETFGDIGKGIHEVLMTRFVNLLLY